MTDDDRYSDLENKIYKNAILNAVKHDGEVNHEAIIGPVIESNPSLRDRAGEVAEIAQEMADDVNSMSTEDQIEAAREMAPDKLEEIVTDDTEDDILPDLPNVDEYDQIRMRCAPNPNGPWHIGHARMPAVIGSYKQKYDGWFCLRFDDTDPSTKRPSKEAYNKILEDIRYLGFEPDDVFRASKRLTMYYEHARRLIEMGKAYTCDLPSDEFSELKKEGISSPNRNKDSDTVLNEFNDMIEGNYSEGDMVLRIKTDMNHKNPAIRDWVAFRMIDRPHPEEYAEDYRCWPMLDFQSAIDDYDLGITHIIRGIDLQSSVDRQGYIYNYFGWEYPEVLHWGHVDVEGYDVPLSTSTINQKIEDGDISGWDDPRAPTLASLKKRGIKGEAITNSMIELGVSSTNVTLSADTLYAKNMEIVDDSANRYFLVTNPVEMKVRSGPETADPPYHPEFDERGRRRIEVESQVRLEREDLPEIGEKVWLKGYGPVVREDEDTFDHTDDDIEIVRENNVPVVHWVGANYVNTEVVRQDHTVTGIAEENLLDESVDNVIQFVRFGFARIESKNDTIRTYFSHE